MRTTMALYIAPPSTSRLTANTLLSPPCQLPHICHGFPQLGLAGFPPPGSACRAYCRIAFCGSGDDVPEIAHGRYRLQQSVRCQVRAVVEAQPLQESLWDLLLPVRLRPPGYLREQECLSLLC